MSAESWVPPSVRFSITCLSTLMFISLMKWGYPWLCSPVAGFTPPLFFLWCFLLFVMIISTLLRYYPLVAPGNLILMITALYMSYSRAVTTGWVSIDLPAYQIALLILMDLLVVACLVGSVASLGASSSKRFYGLYCRDCGSYKVKPKSLLGFNLTCRACGKISHCRDEQPKSKDIYFLCKECGQPLRADPDMGGEEIKCPGCDNDIPIPLRGLPKVNKEKVAAKPKCLVPVLKSIGVGFCISLLVFVLAGHTFNRMFLKRVVYVASIFRANEINLNYLFQISEVGVTDIRLLEIRGALLQDMADIVDSLGGRPDGWEEEVYFYQEITRRLKSSPSYKALSEIEQEYSGDRNRTNS